MKMKLKVAGDNPQQDGLWIQSGPFKLTCKSYDWLPTYVEHHRRRLENGIGLFHLHDWLSDRGIESAHFVIWIGWREIKQWILAHLLMWFWPAVQLAGEERKYYDGISS